MKVLLFSAVLTLFSSVSQAQDSVQQRLGAQFSYHPYDFFTGIHYQRERGRSEHRFFVQAGVNRTFFQSRLYPQLGYRFSYAFLQRAAFRTGVFVQPAVSLLTINRSAKHGTHYWEEAFVGLSVSLGRRSRYQLSGGTGPCVEQAWSAIDKRYQHYFSWNHFLELSWSYAL